jgi:hypothetical protein
MSFFSSHPILDNLGDNALGLTYNKFPYLNPDKIALTWIVYDDPVIVNTGGALSPTEFWQHPVRGYSYRGKELIYPASLVKLFYLVAAFEWIEAGMIGDSAELQRALKDMIVDSSNDATSYIVDLLTGTSSGPDLSQGPMQTWEYQRNIVNRYYQSLGWTELEGININQKTWSDGPYGRERTFIGELKTNRNMLSAESIARLIHAIVGGVAVSAKFSGKMMDLLKRDLADLKSNNQENQISGFLGEVIDTKSQYWSKAGWTSQVRHDVAYIESPNLPPYLLVVLTEEQNNQELLPFISAQIALAMEKLIV